MEKYKVDIMCPETLQEWLTTEECILEKYLILNTEAKIWDEDIENTRRTIRYIKNLIAHQQRGDKI